MQGSPEYLRRLEGDIMRLRERLGIGADQPDWEEGSDTFQVTSYSLIVCLLRYVKTIAKPELGSIGQLFQ